MIRVLFILIVTVLLSSATSAQEPSLKLLFLGDQQGHKPATRFQILQPVLARKGISIQYTENVDDLNDKTLGEFDGLILYANIDSISAKQASALLDYVDSGKGFIPIHCATYCFRNSPEVVALMGAQFKQHGAGEMTTQQAEVEHPLVVGYKSFTSWDETYVHHRHNSVDRVVLEYRHGGMQADGNVREPWTWVRTHGKGRVFYTAWGHDERTWTKTEFHDLMERGIRWACGEGPDGMEQADRQRFDSPPMTPIPGNLKPFEYVDVGPEIPDYKAGHGETRNLMQRPLTSAESLKHISVPEGFHVELFADETMMSGKPICMAWDERGRLWVCETVDYPNELHPRNQGRDRIRILEDTDGDWKADRDFVFAEGLSIPTAIAFHRGGAVVQNGTETLYLKDTDGDNRADVKTVLISNWKMTDTHGGVSNFRNGLDNWIWAMQGYNNSAPIIKGQQLQSFRMGFFRFKLSQTDPPEVEALEFVRSTNNNTWGLGITEEGLIFGSTANSNPSVFMPIPNRYYEQVRGWSPQQLTSIADTFLFHPITDHVRQVDSHGGYTAGAGHAIYTARNYPKSWWNRTAFVCGPTGHLVGTFVLTPNGAGYRTNSPTNLIASDDEWTAPIMAEVGPDGNVWILDWYNYIVQHNPTPQGFETGAGAAYVSDLRDKKHGRIYRILYHGNADPATGSQSVPDLIAQLRSPTMQVRLTAQRLLVERQNPDVVPALIELIQDPSVDDAGLNVGAIHAIQTLKGLGQLATKETRLPLQAVHQALRHRSAGVRLNAIRALPDTPDSLNALSDAGTLNDRNRQVVLASLLALADWKSTEPGKLLAETILNEPLISDRWIRDAATSAAATHAQTTLQILLTSSKTPSTNSQEIVRRTAEHIARTSPEPSVMELLLGAMSKGNPALSEAILSGMANGWPADQTLPLTQPAEKSLVSIFHRVSESSKATVIGLSRIWGARKLDHEVETMIQRLLQQASSPDLNINHRLDAVQSLIQLDPNLEQTLEPLTSLVDPLAPPSLSSEIVRLIGKCPAEGLDRQLLKLCGNATPGVRETIIETMLSRPALTRSLLMGIEQGKLRLSDLTPLQRQNLSDHPDAGLRELANAIIEAGGAKIDPDRAKILESKMALTKQTGDPIAGKAVYKKNCASCHIHKDQGTVVGPNLTGMWVHPKSELLVHILDPSRSVEANYQLYSVLTLDGQLISGLLAAESRTSIEIVDAKGKRITVQREEIDQLRPSTKSAMPDGLESSMKDSELVDLLEFLTAPERYLRIPLNQVATTVTTKGMFLDRNSVRERLVFEHWGETRFEDVPFELINPQGTRVKNAVMLHGPLGPFAPQMPKKVALPVDVSCKAIHLLGGVAGWAAQEESNGGVSMIVRLTYADGKTEDHPLIDGQHIADYIGQFDVPKSKAAFDLGGQQLRYLKIEPHRNAVVKTIELVKPDHRSAPIVMAITVETDPTH